MARPVLQTNLPLALTSFLGREREMADLTRLLSTARLLTLTGAGGSGKTRLALQVAADLLDTPRFPDGVWLVELASLTTPVAVPNHLASVFNVRESPGVPLVDTVVEYLRAKQLLLVLDNCEHLVAACAQLVERLLGACSDLKILATSREALAVPGEISYRVPGLSFPASRHLPSSATLLTFEAIRLFVERTTAAQLDFRLTDANASSIARICERLDGMPLAIELAAARIKSLSVQQIAARLDDRFQLLITGSRTAVSRQQTLLATIEWSYNLLSENEKRLLRQLSVFAGGWTLQAAEHVADNPATLNTLAALVDKSLVTSEEYAGEARYRMLETIREYARNKLNESVELTTSQERHLDYFLKLAEQAEPKLKTAEQIRWLDQLEIELDNLRAAWEWAIEKDPPRALRLIWALLEFDWRRGYVNEGRQWSDHLVLRTEGWSENILRARVLSAAAFFANRQHDWVMSQPLADQALTLAHQAGDKRAIAFALAELGRSYMFRNPRAVSISSQALELYRELGDEWQTAWQLHILASALEAQGNEDQALALHRQSMAIFRQVGDKPSLVYSLTSLGVNAFSAGDHERAMEYFIECIEIDREYGQINHLSLAAQNLGAILVLQGEYQKARLLIEEGLALSRRRGAKDLMVGGLVGMAAVINALGKSEQAVQVLSAAESKFEAVDWTFDQLDRAEYDLVSSAVRTQVDENTYERIRVDASAMTLEQAIDYALEESATLPVSPPPTPAAKLQPDLRILALGPTRVWRGDHELTSSDWTYAKARELFFYLLCSPSRTRDQIGLDLWPDASPAQLRSNLKVTLYHLRRALGSPDWILFEDDQYTFNRSLSYAFDVQVFDSNLAEARQHITAAPMRAIELLEQALKLYQGDFLATWDKGEWYLARQTELQRKYIEALMLLGELRFAQSQYALAIESYRQAIVKDSYLEAAHRELMRCLARQGEPGQALRHYRQLDKLLRDEVGTPPAPETQALYERLKRGESI